MILAIISFEFVAMAILNGFSLLVFYSIGFQKAKNLEYTYI